MTEFEISKISKAITKAFEALEKTYHPSVVDMLALRVTPESEGTGSINDIMLLMIEDDMEYLSSRELRNRAMKILRKKINSIRIARMIEVAQRSLQMRQLWMNRNAGSNRSNTSAVSDMMLLTMPVPPTAETANCSLWQRGMASGAVA